MSRPPRFLTDPMSKRTTRTLLIIAAILAAVLLTAALLTDTPQKGPCDDIDHWACEELNGAIRQSTVGGVMCTTEVDR